MKKEFKCYRIKFKSTLHIGEGKEDYSNSRDKILSDSLHSAIIASLAMQGIEIPEDGNLGFNISDMFPYYKDTYFFPKPLCQKLPRLEDVTKAKKVKKVSWIDLYYFEKALRGEEIVEESKIEDVIKGSFMMRSKKDFEGIYDSGISARVKVSRYFDEDAVPFYMDRMYFKKDAGMYFLAEGNTDNLERALNLLQYEGLGTDRNVGNGDFEYEITKLSIEIPEDKCSNLFSLSTYIPHDKEELNELIGGDNVSYKMEKRGGWITSYPYSTFRKNAIYAFSSGSIFSNNKEISSSGIFIKGKIVDLKPELPSSQKIEHPIWRNGKSIMLPIKIDLI